MGKCPHLGLFLTRSLTLLFPSVLVKNEESYTFPQTSRIRNVCVFTGEESKP